MSAFALLESSSTWLCSLFKRAGDLLTASTPFFSVNIFFKRSEAMKYPSSLFLNKHLQSRNIQSLCYLKYIGNFIWMLNISIANLKNSDTIVSSDPQLSTNTSIKCGYRERFLRVERAGLRTSWSGMLRLRERINLNNVPTAPAATSSSQHFCECCVAISMVGKKKEIIAFPNE